MSPPNDPKSERPLVGSRFELRVAEAQARLEPEQRELMHKGELGYIHSEETGSAVDGPGVRLVFWTTGCEYRCAYCHNPDTWKLQNGRLVGVEELGAEMKKYASFLRMAGGGVTLSGGEPLVQDRFALRVAGEARKLGLHMALDTNGSLGARLSDAELEEFDLYLLDIKGGTDAKHLEVTGMEREPVRKFALRLAEKKRPVWVRFVLVPGLTDGEDNLRAAAEFLEGLGNIQRVDVLPFHQLGRFKWEKLGLEYKLAKAVAPTQETVAFARSVFRNKGLNCPG